MADIEAAQTGLAIRLQLERRLRGPHPDGELRRGLLGPTVDWVQGPRRLRSEDRSFLRPHVDLEPGPARVFLGIVLPLAGESGLRRRYATAARYLSGFGVAMYCGFGRQPGQDGMQTMREPSRVVRLLRGIDSPPAASARRA